MTATVAAPQGNQFGVLLAIFLVITFTTVVVYWNHERRMDRGENVQAAHDQQLATLYGRLQSLCDYLGVDVNDPVDDSPAAMAKQSYERETAPAEVGEQVAHNPSISEPDADTEEFPMAPPTVPDGMPLAVQSALIERPHKRDDAPMLERSVNIGGTMQTFRIRAPREDH